MIPTFIGIVTVTFMLTKLRPDPISQQMMGNQGMKAGSASRQYVQQLRKYYGYDKPVYVQYLYMWKNILTLDFNISRIDQRQVSDKIKEALPYTLTLNIITIFIIYLISIPLGIYSAVHDGTLSDRIITLSLYVLYSLPVFWTALILIRYLAGGDFLDYFPLGGWQSDYFHEFTFIEKIQDLIWHLFLPVTVSVYGSFAFLSKFVKSSFLESYRSEYIKFARAKGLSNRRIIYIHALKNSTIPLITLMAGLLPSLFGGSVIIEKIFSIPGMGKLAFESIYTNDETVIIAVVSISAVLTMIGILITDIVYTIVDPRISFAGGKTN